MNSRAFRVPSTIHVGINAVNEAGAETQRLGAQKALLITDKVLASTGTIKPVVDSLKAVGVEAIIYDGVNSEPTIGHVQEGLSHFREGGCDILLACGGGSPIDVAKAVRILATNQGAIEDFMGFNKISKPGVPLIAIPTTAGTGSEATMVTIITDTSRDVKMLIGSPYLMPTVALVDPALTVKMPRGLTAATGLDALTHAIEAYVSVKAQPMTDILSLSAIRKISRFLPQAWANPENLAARSETMLGALQAGIAFSNSSVALVHGMSRPVGAYFHIPHGVSNAALLGVVMEFSLMGAPERYADVAEAMGMNLKGLTTMEAAQAGSDTVKSLIEKLQIPTLSKLGVTREKLDQVVSKMADDAIESGSPGNNPRKATKDEIIGLYYAAL
ncbi:MAG: iron-containing alcohol dehydrogenase [Deltaproteobacteria bacterium]|nr:iron-containing alcohol dehydrogenase [Deltaproteobacteria bacterium]